MASSFFMYAKKMGWLRAAVLYASQKIRKHGEASIRLPNLASPVLARYGTSDFGMFRQVLIDEEYLFPFKESPKLIIDAGSNVGYASIFFANKFPDATIVAIEPDTHNFELLKRNTASYPQIRCIQAGLWSKDCYLKISNPEGGSCAFRVEETQNPINAITAITIESLLASMLFERIDILKIDIEGSEVEVFAAADAMSWIKRTDLIMIELHDRMIPGCDEAVMSAVQGENFKRSERAENTFLSRY